MSATTDRVHFYERQYLRSHDLTAEQLYHIEMRRRLNLALHLWGIVDGLDLRPSETVPGLAPQFFISRGMAIDAFGREIVVGVDRPIVQADLERNRIQAENVEYFLSIAYTRRLTTPPSAAYRLCDVADQYTRWQESFDVLITADDPRANLGPPPGSFDPLSDDPVARPWPVVLGTVTTGRPPESGGRLIITSVRPINRTYAGLRAQRLVTPASSLTSDAALAIAPFAVDADLSVSSNAFIGGDFGIANQSGNPAPVDPTDITKVNPRGTGVLKVKKDMFLNGELFANVGGEWLTLKDYLQSFIPDVVVDRIPQVKPVPTPNVNGTAVTEDDVEFEVTTRLRDPTKQSAIVALSSIEWFSQDEFDVWSPNSAASQTVKFQVGPPTVQKVSPTKFKFTVHWSIEPTSANPAPQLTIKSFDLSYTAVFTP